MEDKQLADKAINLKGKQYVQVVDRITYFNETYEQGCIRTRLLSDPEQTHYVVEAKVIPDTTTPERYFSGLSQAKLGDPGANREAALENAETSAVGRALAMMGIGVIDSVASSDEMAKAGVTTKRTYKAEDEGSDDMICPYHNVEMFQKGAMRSPGHQDKQRGWCNGQGFSDEKNQWKEKIKANEGKVGQVGTTNADDEEEPKEEKLSGKDLADDVPF